MIELKNCSTQQFSSKDSCAKKKTFVGDRLRLSRQEKKLSQTDLAKLIDATQSIVSCWELDKQPMTIDYAQKIAKVLDISPTIFLDNHDYKRKERPMAEQKPSMNDHEFLLSHVSNAYDICRIVGEKIKTENLATADLIAFGILLELREIAKILKAREEEL